MSNSKKSLPTNNLPILTAEELALAEARWANSSEKKRLDNFQRRVRAKIEVLNVGAFSQIDRNRSFLGNERAE